MKLFSLSDIQPSAPASTDKSEILRTKFLGKHFVKVESLKQLCGRFPAPGEVFFLWTMKSFNAFTFIVYTIKEVGTIDELCLSTYSLNERILASLLKWYDKGEIKSIRITISDSIRHRMPKVYDQIESQKKHRQMEVNYTWNHSKVTLIRAGVNYFAVEGSGNFSENAMHEQYIWTNDMDVYTFRKACICPSEPIGD